MKESYIHGCLEPTRVGDGKVASTASFWMDRRELATFYFNSEKAKLDPMH